MPSLRNEKVRGSNPLSSTNVQLTAAVRTFQYSFKAGASRGLRRVSSLRCGPRRLSFPPVSTGSGGRHMVQVMANILRGLNRLA